MSTVIYHPKGSMCVSCCNATKDCSAMDFKNMRVASQYSPVNDMTIFKVVIYRNYVRDEK